MPPRLAARAMGLIELSLNAMGKIQEEQAEGDNLGHAQFEKPFRHPSVDMGQAVR